MRLVAHGAFAAHEAFARHTRSAAYWLCARQHSRTFSTVVSPPRASGTTRSNSLGRARDSQRRPSALTNAQRSPSRSLTARRRCAGIVRTLVVGRAARAGVCVRPSLRFSICSTSASTARGYSSPPPMCVRAACARSARAVARSSPSCSSAAATPTVAVRAAALARQRRGRRRVAPSFVRFRATRWDLVALAPPVVFGSREWRAPSE